ncbi:FAD-binding oxidoreductase [Ancylobacter sp. 6x-1]|uniref:FAD-binding oxidoreductase n=1 Tax=Ancylobacter crimeensis TaxID=2579147 RepID=A0ABT0DB74_9HYPH|nr:FAD-binding and (Fe-S)-binding domain-containing protein [Ancylobacter crimeensis]MCK0197216.1 FAD-binding oxidoreductase [Ancylobacter crimeensis]
MAGREHEDARQASLAEAPVAAFLATLARAGFRGDIAADAGTRTVFSTDNSIYQLRPAAVLFPRDAGDIALAVRLARHDPVGPIPLGPRGGGTGTNGQSLTRGVVLDTSRHMNGIGALDDEGLRVMVQPGVVLNQLNAFLKPHGLFFPPMVSTASRATIGGMVGTDASGKGSRRYGRTSDYIEALDLVFSDGTSWTARAMALDEAETIARRDDIVGRVHREALRVARENAGEIDAVFPRMNRGLTGYNLKGVIGPDGLFRLSSLLAGSEGTLAVTTGITLRLVRRPAFSAVVPVRYASFPAALADVRRLIAADPSAIEILDDTILGLARQDPVWTALEPVLGGPAPVPVGGLNVVEFVGDSAAEVEAGLAALTGLLEADTAAVIDWRVLRDPATIAEVWSLREKAVGLLGRLSPTKQGTPFVEDTAVPPEALPAYVADFRALLDSHGVAYGMFGHADVGCLHVRPALDLRDPRDAALIRPISDGVAALTRRYGGLIWGEHGRGFRGEFSPLFFGTALYAELCALKGVFDPANILNPGKLARPEGAPPVDRIDAVPLRGESDGAIAAPFAGEVAKAVSCNGNSACFNWDAADPMCPSYKASRDRTQSPKGRAALLREWGRLASAQEKGSPAEGLPAIEHALKASLDTCLSCKACTSQCPIKVDIPVMKARFLARYYATRRRPLREQIIARAESLFAAGRRLPRLANLACRLASAFRLDRALGLVDLPAFRPPQAGRRLTPAGLVRLGALPEPLRQRAVILLEDSFTSSFDGRVVEAADRLLASLGYEVHRAAPPANGKAAHMVGDLPRFEALARATLAEYRRLMASGVAVVAIEPVVALMPAQDYREIAPPPAEGEGVMALEAFLLREIEAGRIAPAAVAAAGQAFALFSHCTERTAVPRSPGQWRAVFAHFGLPLEGVATGCCGMAGLFGHQREHLEMSRRLFDMSWAGQLASLAPGTALATGFSCRCQAGRLAGLELRHPAQALLAALDSAISIRPASPAAASSPAHAAHA